MTRDNSNSKLKKMGRTKRPKLERYNAGNTHTCADARNSSVDRRAYLLQELHCAALRARLQQADIEAVGLALKGDLISPEQAPELLADCDVLRLVGTPPEAQA
jgi:hypothetical protein